MAELTPAERRDQRIAEAKRSAAEKRGETFAPGDAGASPTPPAGPAAEEVEELGNITQAAGELELEADASSTETNSVEEVAAAGDDNQSLADDTSTPPASEPIVGPELRLHLPWQHQRQAPLKETMSQKRNPSFCGPTSAPESARISDLLVGSSCWHRFGSKPSGYRTAHVPSVPRR